MGAAGQLYLGTMPFDRIWVCGGGFDRLSLSGI